MTKQEAIVVSAFTGVLLCEMDDLHAYIETILKRPVFTHEMASFNVQAEIKEAATADLKTIFQREEVLRAAVQSWGEAAQTDMCIEEMSELTKALLKIRRLHFSQLGTPEHQQRNNDVLEEIADVQIMLDQMRLIFGQTEEFENSKIERLQCRLPSFEQEAAQ